MPPGLEGHEFVGHVFVVAKGPLAGDAYASIVRLWTSLKWPPFGITHALGMRRDVPPQALPEDDGTLAVRVATAGGRHQAVLRRTHDVISLSVVRAPVASPRWDTLDAEWSGLLTDPIAGLIGSVAILQARLADPTEVLDPVALGPVVRADNHLSGDWWRHGALRAESPLGPFCVWEAFDPAGGQIARDGRTDRRVVVVAGRDRDRELSAWTWVNGEEMTSFTRYLMHAAKMRYELRVWNSDEVRRGLRAKTDAAIGPLLALADTVADTGREPDADALLKASLPLVQLQAGERGLVDVASRLRDVRRSVEIASTNMAACARGQQDDGLFADDKDLSGWLVRQIDNDTGFLDSAAERARSVAALGDQLVRRGLAARQERFNLGLTGLVGALLMALAAIQSFGVGDVVPATLRRPTVAVLGAFALLVGMVVLWMARKRRTWPAIALCGSAGLTGAAAAWLVGSAVAPSPFWAVGGALAGVVVAGTAVRRG